MFDNADYVHRYTRADAIRDGVLIDVTAVAREAGIRYPVALTAGAWAECVAVPPGVECQDEAGRLWDVIWLMALAIRGSKDGAREVRFAVHVRNATATARRRWCASRRCTAPATTASRSSA